jgi:hypothetical protein
MNLFSVEVIGTCVWTRIYWTMVSVDTLVSNVQNGTSDGGVVRAT